jgi:hypothetical protein
MGKCQGLVFRPRVPGDRPTVMPVRKASASAILARRHRQKTCCATSLGAGALAWSAGSGPDIFPILLPLYLFRRSFGIEQRSASAACEAWQFWRHARARVECSICQRDGSLSSAKVLAAQPPIQQSCNRFALADASQRRGRHLTSVAQVHSSQPGSASPRGCHHSPRAPSRLRALRARAGPMNPARRSPPACRAARRWSSLHPDKSP